MGGLDNLEKMVSHSCPGVRGWLTRLSEDIFQVDDEPDPLLAPVEHFHFFEFGIAPTSPAWNMEFTFD